MTMRRALQIILAISLIGVAFSGTLAYREFFGTAPAATGRCTALGAPGTVLGYPPCVYGLVMYVALVVIASLGLRSGKGSLERPGAQPASSSGANRTTVA